MPGRGAMDDQNFGYDENLAGANNAEFGEEGFPVILTALADSISGTASDPDEALDMCRDLASSENLDEEQYLELVGLVEAQTGWELPEGSERF